MQPRPFLALLLLLIAAQASPVLATSPPDARLVADQAGEKAARPGQSLSLRAELTWDGRPELHVPSPPELTLPPGASVRTGRTASRFDGQKTRWWTELVVLLPEQGTSWDLGPARLDVLSLGSGRTQLTAPAIRVGRPRRAQGLVGQGVGSSLVVLLVLVWAALRDRQLGTELFEPGNAELQRLLCAADPDQPLPCLQALEKLRGRLDELGFVPQGLPSPEELQDRIDRVRFGGESISESECRDMRAAFAAALEN